MQICQIKPALPVDELIHHVEALRQAISHGGQRGGDVDVSVTDPQTPRYGVTDPDGDDSARQGSKTMQSQTLPIPTIAEERSKTWVRIVDLLGQRLPALAANLQQSSLVSADEDIFEIEVQGNEFSINRVRRRESIQAIRRAVKDLFGWSPKITIHGISKDPAAKREKKIHEDQLKQQALSHPMVSEIVELFQGKVMDVKVLPPSEKKESI